MKKSMLTLVGCVLAAGSVMAAAEVTGNNIAVVIKKDAVVSNNNYQFLIVPVKGFDITGRNNAQSLKLAEILPPAAYGEATLVYSADYPVDDPRFLPPCKIIVDAGVKKWALNADKKILKNDATVAADTILWMKTTENVPPTVFCGELSTTGATVTPTPGQFVAFGNAKSEDVNLSAIEAGGFEDGDMIYAIKAGTSDYLIYYYDGEEGEWTMPSGTGGMYISADSEVLPAGAAAYYYRSL